MKKNIFSFVTLFFLVSCVETQTTVSDNTQLAKKFDIESQNNYNLFEGHTLKIIDINIDKTSLEISESVSYSCYYDLTLDNVVMGSTPCTTLTGFNFNTSNGTIDWTPGFDIVTSDVYFEIKVIATDGVFSDSEIFRIKLVDRNRRPELGYTSVQYIDEGSTINLDFDELNTADDEDLDGDAVFYTCEYRSQEAQYVNLSDSQLSTISILSSLVDNALTEDAFNTYYSNLISYVSSFTNYTPEVWTDCTNIFDDPIKGLSFNAGSGAFEWTPNKNEQHEDKLYRFKITISDGVDETEREFSIVVKHVNTEVEITDFSDMQTYTISDNYYTYEGVAIENLRFNTKINLSAAAGATNTYSCYYDTDVDKTVSTYVACSTIGVTFNTSYDRFEYDGSVGAPADGYDIKLIRGGEEVVYSVDKLEDLERIDDDGEFVTFKCYYDESIDGSVTTTTQCNEVGFNLNSNTGEVSFTPAEVDSDSEYEFKIMVSDKNQSSSSTLFGVYVKNKSKLEFNKIAFGEDHTCAISKTGEIYCWGDNDFGQQGVGDKVQRRFPLKIVADSDNPIRFQEIKTQKDHTCALSYGGDLYCWGNNSSGQLGIGDTVERQVPVKMEFATNVSNSTVVDFAVGENHTCVINSLGRVYCVGDNTYGQLGMGASTSTKKLGATPISFNLYTYRNIYRIEAGDNHTCAISGSGAMYCWGRNDQGQLGNGSATDIDLPYKVTDNAADFTLGANHTCYIDLSLQPFCFGDNDNGQLGVGDTADRNTPTATVLAVGVEIKAGREHTCLIDGAVTFETWCFGRGDEGQLGDNTSVSNDSGTVATGTLEMNELFVGEHSNCMKQASGLLCWGDNGNYQFLDGSTTDYDIPQSVGLSSLGYSDNAITDVYIGKRNCFTKASGEGYCTGLAYDIDTSFETEHRLFPPTTSTYFEEIRDYLSPGSSSGVAIYITRDRKYYPYGANTESFWSNAGSGFAPFYSIPVGGISYLGNDVSLSEEHLCFMGDNKNWICNGENSSSEHGDGASANDFYNNIGGAYKKIVTGKNHTCGLDYEGDIYCSGEGRAVGQGGTDQTTPTLIDTSDYINLKFIDVFAGNNSTCGISDKHELYCFGDYYTTDVIAYISQPTKTYYKRVEISDTHFCALSTSSETYCWGDNTYGQLGNGTVNDYSVPIKISHGTSSLNKFKDISVGESTSCGVSVGGSLYCWGKNSVLMNFTNLTEDASYLTPQRFIEN